MSCSNCGHNQIHALNRCHRCYSYFNKHGIERPAHLIQRYNNPHPPLCLNCQSPEIYTRDRCKTCYFYYRRYGVERPLEPAQAPKIEHLRRCACKRNYVTRIIFAKILSPYDTIIEIAIPVCEDCYTLEYS